MSALSQVTSDDKMLQSVLTIAHPIFADAIWQWFETNSDRVLFRKWFITIRVRDVRWVFEQIAGTQPTPSPADQP